MRKVSSENRVQNDDPFIGFDYAQPPLAEIQILRLLENHIKRKKRDQLDKARHFKEKLLKKEQDAKHREEEEKVDYESCNAKNPQEALKVRT